MTTLNTTTANTPAITNITITSNTDIEFVCNGRLYVLLVEQQHLDNTYGATATYWENPYNGNGYNDTSSELTLAAWNTLKISEADALEVIQANATSWDDVTECTDKGLAMLAQQAADAKKAARRNLLSHIVSTANKCRKFFATRATAMRVAWNETKILASAVINFIKVDDFDSENPTIHTRRVTGGKFGKNGLILFHDLDKIAANIASGMDEIAAKSRSIISMHVWQIV